MALQSFKHVGIRTHEASQQSTAIESSVLPVGIKTPMSLGVGSDLMDMHFSVADQIKDNLRNLLVTNHGERVGFYDLGANLYPLLSEYSNKQEFDQEAMVRINTTTTKWMPFVDLEGFDSRPLLEDNKTLAQISLLIEFSVPSIQLSRQRLELVLSAM